MLVLLLWGCGRCGMDDPVTGGCGVELEEGVVRLGDERERVEQRLGEPSRLRDHGPVGLRPRGRRRRRLGGRRRLRRQRPHRLPRRDGDLRRAGQRLHRRPVGR